MDTATLYDSREVDDLFCRLNPHLAMSVAAIKERTSKNFSILKPFSSIFILSLMHSTLRCFMIQFRNMTSSICFYTAFSIKSAIEITLLPYITMWSNGRIVPRILVSKHKLGQR